VSHFKGAQKIVPPKLANNNIFLFSTPLPSDPSLSTLHTQTMPTFANNYKVEIYSAISAIFIKYNAPDEIKEFLQEDFRSQSKFADLDDIPETDVDLTAFDRLRFGPNGSVTFDQVWKAFIEHYYLMFKVKSTIRYENGELVKD
jgi:hypothetical protein